MADLGFLNFGVGVDGEDLLAKALEKDKQEALEIQKILSSIKIEGVNFGGIEDAVYKSKQASDKAAISSVKLGDAREKAAASSLIGEQKLQSEIEKTAAIQGKSAAEISSIQKQASDKSAIAQSRIATESQKAAAIQNAASDKSRVSTASLMALEKERSAKQAIYQQKLATEFQRTEAARSRAQLAFVTGEKNANNAIGMTNKTMFSQKELLRQISNAAGIYFSIYQVGAFVKNLAMVSGEFEMQRISLENILQDVDAANKLFGQIKGLSVVSPFEFKDLVGYTKQLSAFSIPLNELYDTTKSLADVSAGLGVDMGRIILAYGQVRSASVLRGQELRQFTEAGIPLVDELAKKFGELEGRVVSAGEVFDKISNRLVPFAMVKDIFSDLTSEGGKFFEMQEKQSESLKGKIANLKDAYDIMLYSIGTANDGILKGGVEAISSLMKNWETFADALMAVVAAYGVYRTAIILNTVLAKSFTEATHLSTIAIKIHDAALKATPFGLALAGITALIGGIIVYTNSISRSNAALMDSIGTINKQADSYNDLLDKLKLLTSATDSDKEASTERASIISKLNNIEPDLAKNIKEHATNLNELTKIQEHYNAIMGARKFAEYAISDSGNGVFNEGIINDFEDLEKAENKADMAAVKLAGKFSIIDEEWRRVKEEWKKGNFLLPESDFKKMDDIMSSSVSEAEKLAKIYNKFHMYGSVPIKNIIGKVGDYGGVVDYINKMYDLKEAAKEADEEIRKIEIQIRTNLKNKGINVFDPKEADNMRTLIKSLEKLSKLAQTKILAKWGIKFETPKGDDPKNELDGWRKEIKDIVGNSILIQTDSNIGDTIKAIQEKIADNKKKMETLEPTLVKFGYDFGKMEFPKNSQVNDPTIHIWQKEPVLAAAESYKVLYDSQKDCEKAARGLNIELQKTGGAGSNKDLIAEKFQNQIDLIKKAQALYEKYTSIMSKEGAVKKVQNDGRFSKTFNPDNYKISLESIYKQLGNSPEQRKIKESLSDLFSDINFGKVKKGVDEIMKKVGDEIDKFKDNYDFYEKLLGAGEDKQTAIDMAFGVAFSVDEVYLGKNLSEIVKNASNKVGLTLDFDINKGDITKQIGGVYDKLTPELKKQVDALEKYRQDSFENSYLKYLSFVNKETPMGSGITFDFSKVLAKMKDGINDANKTFDFLEDNENIDTLKLKTQKDLEIKYQNEIALNETKNIGAEFIERSLKNSQYWNEYKNLSNASYGDTKKILEELSKIQEEALSKTGLEKIFSTNKIDGNTQDENDKLAFDSILRELGNAENITKLNEQVDLYLQNITEHKEEQVGLNTKLNNLDKEQLTKLQLILTFIKSISNGIEEAEVKTKKIQLDDQINAFKNLSNAAANVIDNVEGLSDAFGAEFDDITNGSLDVVKIIASNSMDVANTIAGFVDKTGKAMSLSAMLAGDAIKKVEASSVILTIISTALQIASKIASIIKGNKTKETDNSINESQQQLSDLEHSYDQTEKAAEKFYTLNPDSASISKWLSSEKAAIKARFGYLKQYGDRGEQILKSMYDDADKKADSMAGMSYFQIQEKSIEQQKRVLEEQIKAAEGDNSNGKRDEEIEGYKNQLNGLDTKLAETKEKWLETMRGFSMQDVANEFAKAWVDAFEKGEDSIDALNKKFNELIKNMIIKQAAMRVVSSSMKNLLKMIDDAIGEDGVLDGGEVAEIMGALPATLQLIDKGMNDIIKPLLDKIGATFGSASEAGDSLSKGIEGIKENTANLLASYINAMRSDVSNQKIYFQKIIDAIIPMSSLFSMQIAELRKIEANTYRTANNTEKNVEILDRIEFVLNSITRQGSGKRINI